MSDYLKIGANTAAQLVSKVVTTASTLVITLLVTHNLSQSDWGIFITITSYVALFYVIADFGLNGIVTRELVIAKEKISEYFSNLLALRIILSLLTIFLALAVLAFTGHSNVIKVGIILSLVNVLTLSLFNSAVAIFQTKLRYDQAALADISGSVVTLVLTYLFIISGFSIIFVIVSFVIGGVVRAFVSLTLSKVYIKSFRLSFNFTFWKSLMITALPIGLTLLFSQFVANIDKQVVYLADYKPELNINNDLAAAFYGLAYRIFEFGIVIPAFFVNSVYPFLIKEKVKDKVLLKNSLLKYGKILLAVSVFVTIIVFFLSPYMVRIFGEYERSSNILRILSFGYLFFYVTPLLMWTIVSLGKEKLLPFVFGIAFLFNLAANLYFVPRFGFSAAAVITVITEVVILVWLLVILAPEFWPNWRKQNETS